MATYILHILLAIFSRSLTNLRHIFSSLSNHCFLVIRYKESESAGDIPHSFCARVEGGEERWKEEELLYHDGRHVPVEGKKMTMKGMSWDQGGAAIVRFSVEWNAFLTRLSG